MILEMLAIGGAITLFAKKKRERDYLNEIEAYSQSVKQYSYSYDDFKNDLLEYTSTYWWPYDYRNSNLPVCPQHDSYRRRVRFRNKIDNIYHHICQRGIRVSSLDQVLTEYFRRKDIAVNIKEINEILLSNCDVIFQEKLIQRIRSARILTIRNFYNLSYTEAKKYSYLKGVANQINPQMTCLIEDEKVSELFCDSLMDVKKELKECDYGWVKRNQLPDRVHKKIVNQLIEKTIVKYEFKIEKIKEIILSEIPIQKSGSLPI